MRTWVTERFGLTVPVVAAPMAGVSTGRLAAAVSAAGGLGMIGAGPTSRADWLREQCAVAREAGHFGVGLIAWALAQDDALVDVVAAEAPALVSLSYGPYERWIEPLPPPSPPTCSSRDITPDLCPVPRSRAQDTAAVAAKLSRRSREAWVCSE